MKLQYIGLLLLILLLVACVQKAEKKITAREIKDTDSIQLSVFINKSSSTDHVNLGYINQFYELSEYDLKKANPLKIKILTTKPIFLKDLSINQTNYILYPGENLNILSQNTDNHKLLFKLQIKDSIRNNELNFFQALQLSQQDSDSYKLLKALSKRDIGLSPGLILLLSKFALEIKMKNPDLFDSYITAKYKENLQFMKNYKTNYTVSDSFEKLVLKFFLYDYISDKISIGINLMKKGKAMNRNLKANIDSLKEQLSCDSCFFIPSYKDAVSNYLEYILLERKITDLNARYNLSQYIFKGKTSDFASFLILKEMIDQHPKGYTQILPQFYARNKNPEYVDYIRKNEDYKNIVPDSTSTLLQDVNGNTLDFNKLLAKHRGKVILLDFWASWCSPCKENIPFSKKIHQKYLKKPLSIIYLSLDTKKTNWETGNKELSLNNSYIVVNHFNSDLAKYLKINSIPRYVLFDKHGKIYIKDAPRPGTPDLERMITNLLN